MRIVVAGGHGQIALHLNRQLVGRGDEVVALIRNPAQSDSGAATGAAAVLADLETTGVAELAGRLTGADAVIFAAGAGPGSGVARKDTVDRGAAVLLAEAAETAGVRRYLLISSMGVESPPSVGADETWAAYLRAKRAAELDVMARRLDWTVLRPGRLTDDAPTDCVTLADSVPSGDISRADVAAVLVALLDRPDTAGRVLEVVSGPEPIPEAVADVAGQTRH